MGRRDYVAALLHRAWRRTWAMVVGRSPTDIARDAILAALGLVVLWFSHGLLVKDGLISKADSVVIDTAIWVAMGVALISVLFAIVFVIEAIFVTPFVLVREARKLITIQKSETPKALPSLLDLFHQDFYVSKFTSTLNISVGGKPNVSVILDVCNDPDLRAEYYALYLPYTDDAMEVISHALGSVPGEAKRLNDSYRMISSSPGDFDPEESKNVVFTGRVFLYSDSHLTHKQVAIIQEAALLNGFYVKYRGHEYWVSKALK